MQGRVLNFLEFSDKYSNGNNEPATVDDMIGASNNFEEGFDDSTYDQPQIGPNRPVSGNYEMTPAMPGEESNSFTEENSEEMEAPKPLPNQVESKLNLEKETEEDDEDEEEIEEEEEDTVEDGNPEAGANPKKKVEESLAKIKGFSEFVNEFYTYAEEDLDLSDEDTYFDEDDTCPNCGETPISNEYGTSCGCNN
jgi:hypothetical protein